MGNSINMRFASKSSYPRPSAAALRADDPVKVAANIARHQHARQVSLGIRASLWRCTQQVGHLDSVGAHDVEHQEREAKAVKAPIELVDERLLRHVDVVGLQHAAQFLVGQPFVTPQLKQELLGMPEVNLLIHRAEGHWNLKIVYELSASYARVLSLAVNNS